MTTFLSNCLTSRSQHLRSGCKSCSEGQIGTDALVWTAKVEIWYLKKVVESLKVNSEGKNVMSRLEVIILKAMLCVTPDDDIFITACDYVFVASGGNDIVISNGDVVTIQG